MEHENTEGQCAERTEACSPRVRGRVVGFSFRRTPCSLLKDRMKGRKMTGKKKTDVYVWKD